MQTMNTNGLDWSQWIYPGPRRTFSAEEMARAGGHRWPGGIDFYVYSNALIVLLIFHHQMPRGLRAAVFAGAMLSAVAALAVARWLWRRPTRLNLNLASLAAGLCTVGTSILMAELGYRPVVVLALPFALGGLVLILSAWWFLTLYRVQQIEARLREQADHEAGLRLSRRLATAQLQPHFLFNTLASLQHWVDTLDPRASPTLGSFTRYLRATLPMFERDALSLAEELAIVRSYLEVMQARLGERLRWELLAEPGLDALLLPPGALLTLVENAIVHGIEPSVRGGRIQLRVRAEPGRVLLEVSDDGAGIASRGESGSTGSGVGLSNTRVRLAQLHGERAQLEIVPLQPGCLSRITIFQSP